MVVRHAAGSPIGVARRRLTHWPRMASPMTSWIVAGLTLNAALVAAAIVFALRLAGRNALATSELQWKPFPPSFTPTAAAVSRLPPFSSAQMERSEWRALLDALDAARTAYRLELTAWHGERDQTFGALTRAKHGFEVAKSRLLRFEREVN